MDFFIRLAQVHESFRKPELEALAQLLNIQLEFIEYNAELPYCLVRLSSEAEAKALISRSILADSIYELWGEATDYESLHAYIKHRTSHKWRTYEQSSFKFSVHGFRGKRSTSEQRELINTFAYLPFRGPIKMTSPDEEFKVFEVWPPLNPKGQQQTGAPPQRLYFGRQVGESDRNAATKFSLKKRAYINTTSMDAELALVSANLAHAAPGRVFLDPFVGTGGFCVSVAHFGAMALGADIDARVVKGDGRGKNIEGNFKQYGLEGLWWDGVICDLTNSPFRKGRGMERWIDGILCDPPYGIREGCKVLGSKSGPQMAMFIDGVLAHLKEGYIPPKRPYSFDALLHDILHFAAEVVVDNGRLAMWMPTANDDDVELAIPHSPYLKLSSVCVQSFNKWSRRLLTYVRLPEKITGPVAEREIKAYEYGTNADGLNNFRRRYFEGFKSEKPDGIDKNP